MQVMRLGLDIQWYSKIIWQSHVINKQDIHYNKSIKADRNKEKWLHYHVRNLEVSIGKHDGVRWGGHGQHEGKGCTQGTGEHDVQWIEANGT